jgi:HEAT repeat protein
MLSSWWDSLRLKSTNPVLASWWGSLRLKSSDPNVRSKAVENLSSSWHSRDTERVFASLRDESPQVRCAAVRALEKSKRPEAFKSLIGALSDRAPEVREAVVLVLSRLAQAGKAKDAVGVLTGCLRDPEPSVRRAAAGGLRTLGWRPSTREESARFDLALSNSPETISPAPTLAPDPSPETNTAFHRRMRAEAEKEKNDPARVSALLAAAHSGDLLARISAIHDLGQATARVVSEELLKFVCHREPEVRLAAVQALSMRADTLPAHLLGCLEDSSSDVRLTAVRYFARVPNRQITPLLLPLLSDSVVNIREAAATAIGFDGNTGGIEDLVVALMDEDGQVRDAAHRSLDRIDPNWTGSDGAKAARPRLESMLSTCQQSDAERLQQLLDSIGPRDSYGDALSTPSANYGYQG